MVAFDKERQEWRNKLIYIDNYPITWKYVSLFVKPSGDEESDRKVAEIRDANMKKILAAADRKT